MSTYKIHLPNRVMDSIISQHDTVADLKHEDIRVPMSWREMNKLTFNSARAKREYEERKMKRELDLLH